MADHAHQMIPLSESEQTYRILFDLANDCLIILSEDGFIRDINRTGHERLGYEKAELVGQHITELDPPEYAAKVPERFALIKSQRRAVFETAHVRKDGTIMPVEVNARFIELDGQRYIFSVIRDITERKKADAALLESEERLHQAIRVSHTGIFDHDHVTDTIYWSPEQRANYGWGPDEVVTLERFLGCLYPDDLAEISAAVQRAHDPNGDGRFDVQHRIVRRDGEIRWLSTRSQTYFEGEGAERRPVRTVGAVLDVTDRMRTEEKITHLAFYDSLTGLANRRLLRDRLAQALAISARHIQFGALLYIDLDHFKTINDAAGHEHGDMLLCQVADRLKSVIRESDTIARLGGDEFVVVLEELPRERQQAAAQTKAVSDKVLETLAKRYDLGKQAYSGTASIGIVMFRGHEDSVDELLKRADMAMYAAKKGGRNTACFFDPTMQSSVERRARLEDQLHGALQRSEFELYYQPRIGPGGRVAGAEALIRWRHPERGIVAPGEFIGLSEETGLILPIGQWVLDAACDQLRIWERDPVAREYKISVNISARQFRQENFVAQVAEALERTDVDPSRLELELTESMFLEDIEQSIAKMQALREAGVLFSLDDFGTGYSSLSYLKRLPLSQVKVDRSFVRDIVVDQNDRAIVRTIIQMGQTLGLEVVAEGVETEEQRRMLEEYGCQGFQGFLFGRPVPIEEFERAFLKGG